MADVRVQSEITGKVWAIEASVGDKLSEEDTIIVLESMKMDASKNLADLSLI